MIIPVILSGGSGTRLWPVSTATRPKQFHSLVGDSSMFRQTLDRAADRARFAAPIIVCGPEHVDRVEAELAEAKIVDAKIIVEPAGRNTAPAIALAALSCEAKSILLVMPADHVMTNARRLHEAIEAAIPAVRDGALATFGIDPSHPESNYGYIEADRESSLSGGLLAVTQFVEKPNRISAEAMIRKGGYFWNAGIFLMRADRYLAELVRQQPKMAVACSAAMSNAQFANGRIEPRSADFLSSPSNSIDYAVMERASNVVVAPVDPGWSDVGGWAALYDFGAKDENENVLTGDVVTIDAKRNYVRADMGKRVSIAGIADLVVVVEGDDILILPRESAQDTKLLAQRRALKGSVED